MTENLIQFVTIHDFTYSQGLLAVHDVTAMGNVYRNALYAMGTELLCTYPLS